MSGNATIVYYPAPGRVYSDAELAEIFARYSVNDPLMVALRQIFQARFAAAAVDNALPRLSEREAGHAAGRLWEISEFRDEVLSYLGARHEPAAATPEPTQPAGRLRHRAREKQ